jgi:hypothetical protein
MSPSSTVTGDARATGLGADPARRIPLPGAPSPTSPSGVSAVHRRHLGGEVGVDADLGGRRAGGVEAARAQRGGEMDAYLLRSPSFAPKGQGPAPWWTGGRGSRCARPDAAPVPLGSRKGRCRLPLATR